MSESRRSVYVHIQTRMHTKTKSIRIHETERERGGGGCRVIAIVVTSHLSETYCTPIEFRPTARVSDSPAHLLMFIREALIAFGSLFSTSHMNLLVAY